MGKATSDLFSSANPFSPFTFPFSFIIFHHFWSIERANPILSIFFKPSRPSQPILSTPARPRYNHIHHSTQAREIQRIRHLAVAGQFQLATKAHGFSRIYVGLFFDMGGHHLERVYDHCLTVWGTSLLGFTVFICIYGGWHHHQKQLLACWWILHQPGNLLDDISCQILDYETLGWHFMMKTMMKTMDCQLDDISWLDSIMSTLD